MDYIANTIQVHIAAYNKDIDDYLYLVLQRSDKLDIYPSLWQVVTGFIEENETAVDAAIRETKEETGLTPISIWTLPYLTSFFNAKRNIINFAPVFGFLVEFQENIKLSEEHSAYKWVNFEECLKILELPSHKEGTIVFNSYVLSKNNKDMFKFK